MPHAQQQRSKKNKAKNGGNRNQTPYRRKQIQPWWQSPWLYGAIGVGIVAILVVFVVLSQQVTVTPDLPVPAGTVPQSILTSLTNPDPANLSKVGAGSLTTAPIATVPSTAKLSTLTLGGKPDFLYIGAEYCPYCAAERWPFIMALSRFGSFSNLHYMRSSSTDIYPNTPSFTFNGSTYTSAYVSFSPVEELTRTKTTLQTPTVAQTSIIQLLDYPPYVSTQAEGSIPFYDIANVYFGSGASYLPTVINGMSWKQVASALKDPKSAQSKAIMGTANYMTAGICLTTKNLPASVCTLPYIKTLEAQIQKTP